MADENEDKKVEEKAKPSRASKLYDRSKMSDEKKPEAKAEEKAKAEEPKNDKGQTQGEERDDVSDKSPVGEGAAATPTPMEQHMERYKAMNARHEGERRDAYAAQREALRTMQTRHAKEHRDMMDEHFSSIGGGKSGDGEAGAGGEPAPADGAAKE